MDSPWGHKRVWHDLETKQQKKNIKTRPEFFSTSLVWGRFWLPIPFPQPWRMLIRTDGKPNADDKSLKATINTGCQGFSGSPVVKTLCFHCRGCRFSSWPGKSCTWSSVVKKITGCQTLPKHHWSAGMVVTVSHDSRESSPRTTYRTSTLRLQEPMKSKTSRRICIHLIQNCFSQNFKKKNKKKPSFFSWLSSISLCTYKSSLSIHLFVCI